MKKRQCKFCGREAPSNMRGYCQACYKYFITQGKDVYPLPSVGKIEYTESGDCICHICGKAYRKLGDHVTQAHEMTAREYFKKFKINCSHANASNITYRTHMRDIQKPYTISDNLLEKGKATRFKKGQNR